MGFLSIPESAVNSTKAFTQELINRFRLNFDNHETRIVSIEAASSTSGFLVGEIKSYAGTTLPTDFLWCDGSEVSKATYSDLWSALGSHVYGTPGDPTNNFLLPDLRGRLLCGLDNANNSVGTGGGDASRVTSGGSGLDGDTLGTGGGAQTVTLTLSEWPSHDHDWNDPQHNHSITDSGHEHDWDDLTGVGATPNDHNVAFDVSSTNSVPGVVVAVTTGVTVNNASTGITYNSKGSGSAHTNMPPCLILNSIIRATT